MAKLVMTEAVQFAPADYVLPPEREKRVLSAEAVAKKAATAQKKIDDFSNHILPTYGSRLYSIGEMNGWTVRAVWVDYTEVNTSLSLRFKKKGQNPCAATWDDRSWAGGYLQGYPGVVRTMNNFTKHLSGELDLEAERLIVYPPDPDIDKPPGKDAYVEITKRGRKSKMLESKWLEFVASQTLRKRPDWIK